MHQAIASFCELYQSFNANTVSKLTDIYSDNVVFEDPVHKIVGLDDLQSYFEGLLTHLSSCQFTIQEVVIVDQQGFISWEMTLTHTKLNKGQPVIVSGTSHLRFTDKVHYHRDYFDMGAMVYSHLPIVGTVISYIKRRMAA